MQRLLILCFIGSMLCLGTSINAANYHETVYYSTDQALKKVFPHATLFKKVDVSLTPAQQDRIQRTLGWVVDTHTFESYIAYKQATVLGYGIIIDEAGKYEPITCLVGSTIDFSVKEVVVMVYREKYGSAVRKKRFLRQFIHKKSSDSLYIDQDIMGVSGATVSSWSLVAGVKKALLILEDVFRSSLNT